MIGKVGFMPFLFVGHAIKYIKSPMPKETRNELKGKKKKKKKNKPRKTSSLSTESETEGRMAGNAYANFPPLNVFHPCL